MVNVTSTLRPAEIPPRENLGINDPLPGDGPMLVKDTLNGQARKLQKQETLARNLGRPIDRDDLTGLPNRRSFRSVLEKATSEGRNSSQKFALILIDIDRFRTINDTFGQTAGDYVLKAFADRLRGCAGKANFVARVGSDEFAVLVRHPKDQSTLSSILETISERLKQPLTYDGKDLQCPASIGVATYPENASSAEELIRYANLALSTAKKNRNGSVHFHRAWR